MYIVCILYVYVNIFLQFSLFSSRSLFSISFSTRFKFQRVLVYLLAKFAFDIAEKEPSKVCPVDSASRVKHSVKNSESEKHSEKHSEQDSEKQSEKTV